MSEWDEIAHRAVTHHRLRLGSKLRPVGKSNYPKEVAELHERCLAAARRPSEQGLYMAQVEGQVAADEITLRVMLDLKYELLRHGVALRWSPEAPFKPGTLFTLKVDWSEAAQRVPCEPIE